MDNENEPQIRSQSPKPIPSVYFNGFQVALSTADILITIQHSNNSILNLSLSYTTAKTLAEKLEGAINLLEKRSKSKIMSIEEVGRFLQEELKDTKGKNVKG